MTGTDYIRSTARTVLYAYAYVALEWLFFVTKPSFLGAWPWSSRLNALLAGAVPLLLVALALHLALCLVSLLATRAPRLAPYAGSLLRITPTLVGTAIVLMLADNFTYTVFGWGIVDTGTYTAPLYWLMCLLVFVLLLRRAPALPRHLPIAAGALILATAIGILWVFHRDAGVNLEETYASSLADRPLPNIIVFASDGIPADHMSAYGYARKTTPNLDAYLDQALVADNAFTNASATTGSLSSVMTGKYPATTKLLLPPYTLDGKDAYEHLPRILHRLGYTNLQETVRYYADGPDLNWKESFDFANGRAVSAEPVNYFSFVLRRPLQFSKQLYERLSDRVEQLLFIKRMTNPHAAVTERHGKTLTNRISDRVRMGRVMDFIRNTQGPFFIHIHLLDSHCCKFRVPEKDRHFSAAKFDDPKQHDTAIFDDTILRSDRYFGRMMELLKQRGLLDNTLIVYTSDHDKGWDFRSPVPLIFLFPGGEHQGHLAQTTQLLDIAPTLLDYLKVQVPDWMEGQSVIDGALKPERPVFSIYQLGREHIYTNSGDRVAQVVDMGPPNYGLQVLGMVVCHRWYLMDLDSGNIKSGQVGDFKNPVRAVPGAPLPPTNCTDDLLPDTDEALTMMRQHLQQRGFGL